MDCGRSIYSAADCSRDKWQTWLAALAKHRERMAEIAETANTTRATSVSIVNILTFNTWTILKGTHHAREAANDGCRSKIGYGRSARV